MRVSPSFWEEVYVTKDLRKQAVPDNRGRQWLGYASGEVFQSIES